MVTGDSGGLWEGDLPKLEPGNLASGTSLQGCSLRRPCELGSLEVCRSDQRSPSLEGVRRTRVRGGPWPTALGKQAAGLKGPESSVKAPWLPCGSCRLPQGDRRNCAWVPVGRTPPVGQAGTLPLQRDAGATDKPEPETASTGATQPIWALAAGDSTSVCTLGENKLTFVPCQSKNML